MCEPGIYSLKPDDELWPAIEFLLQKTRSQIIQEHRPLRSQSSQTFTFNLIVEEETGKINTKQKRKRPTKEQRSILEEFYEIEGKFPSKERKLELAESLNMNPRRIQIWFQNKRAKDQRLKKEHRIKYQEI
jgi:hypothetical protein